MRVGIVGGGITGLACAHYLGQAGIECVVFDTTPGGLIGTVRAEGCILETGPESWLASKPWAEQLIREIGLGDQLAGSNDARRRTYVVRDGRFVRLPEGLQLVVPTRIGPVLRTELFSWGTKWRMGTEIFRNPKALPDRSVAEFVAEHFGQEAVDYLAEPLLAGVYGGSPDTLSAVSVLPKFVEHEQRYGSIVVGALREKRNAAPGPVFKSMRDGMGTVIDRLREKTTIVSARAESVQQGGIFAAGEWHLFDQIVLCCGANRAAPLMAPIDERVGELLGSIPHTGSAIWTFGYRREDVPGKLDAFGFLVPKRERQTIMACTWVATKWPGRVPEDKAVLRCFATDTEANEADMRRDLTRLMKITAEPVFSIVNRWPESMPQYTVGHGLRIAEVEARMTMIRGIYLAGNAYHGVGIPDCVRGAKEVAKAIVAEGV